MSNPYETARRESKVAQIVLDMETQMLHEFHRSLDDPGTYRSMILGVQCLDLSDETRKCLLDRLDQIAQSRRAAVVVRAVG